MQAIVNNEHWVTRRYAVKNHVAGSAEFDYDYAEHGSYVETKAPLADGPGPAPSS